MGDRRTSTMVTGDVAPIRQLVDRVGPARASELMGVDKNNFKRWFETGEARLAYILAAKHCLSKMDKEVNSTAIAIVVVPSGQRAGFDHVVKAMNLDTKYVVK